MIIIAFHPQSQNKYDLFFITIIRVKNMSEVLHSEQNPITIKRISADCAHRYQPKYSRSMLVGQSHFKAGVTARCNVIELHVN